MDYDFYAGSDYAYKLLRLYLRLYWTPEHDFDFHGILFQLHLLVLDDALYSFQV